MKNKSFLIGIFLSPLLLAGYYWLWPSSSRHIETVTPQQLQFTLADTGYIPTKPRASIPNHPFYQLHLQDNSEPLTKTISDFAGKPVILHIWAPWCESCVVEMPHLEKFAEQHKEDVHIIAVAIDNREGKSVKDFYRSKGFQNLSLFVDENGVLGNILRVNSLPTSIFISRTGEEMGRIIGPVDWEKEPGALLVTYLSKKG